MYYYFYSLPQKANLNEVVSIRSQSSFSEVKANPFALKTNTKPRLDNQLGT